MRLNESSLFILLVLECIVTYNYPIIVLNVDVSSLANKVVHYFDMAIFNCQVEGSHLMEKMKLQQ